MLKTTLIEKHKSHDRQDIVTKDVTKIASAVYGRVCFCVYTKLQVDHTFVKNACKPYLALHSVLLLLKHNVQIYKLCGMYTTMCCQYLRIICSTVGNN